MLKGGRCTCDATLGPLLCVWWWPLRRGAHKYPGQRYQLFSASSHAATRMGLLARHVWCCRSAPHSLHCRLEGPHQKAAGSALSSRRQFTVIVAHAAKSKLRGPSACDLRRVHSRLLSGGYLLLSRVISCSVRHCIMLNILFLPCCFWLQRRGVFGGLGDAGGELHQSKRTDPRLRSCRGSHPRWQLFVLHDSWMLQWLSLASKPHSEHLAAGRCLRAV